MLEYTKRLHTNLRVCRRLRLSNLSARRIENVRSQSGGGVLSSDLRDSKTIPAKLAARPPLRGSALCRSRA